MPDLLPYQNPQLPFSQRVDDLVSRMTLEEKVSQMVHGSAAIERLGIPAYNWWNECLHGVGRAGIATVFPQAIGMAATWNADLIHTVAVAISDEGRAKHHQALREGNHGQYYGLTFWTPNINIFRDPRWGRGQETYGECPYLTARLGVAFIKGLQGDDPKYLKTVATPKHYAVHSGPEHSRHHFDVDVSARDLRQTYLPQFKAAIREGRAYSIMSAYQRFRGQACSASTLLLEDILRQEWGFEGYVVSDCWAIEDIYKNHRIVETPEEAAALAVKAGCDLACGQVYEWLVKAVDQGLVDEATIDRSVKRLFMARFMLGMFDPPEQVPYAQIPYEVNDSPAHRELALRVARESLVLLKNDGLLPIDPAAIKTIAVIGPNADSVEVLHGNYNGIAAVPVTPLAGIRARLGGSADVLYVKGCDVVEPPLPEGWTRPSDHFAAAVDIARRADVAVVVMGLSQALEGEEGQREGVGAGKASQGDRPDLGLPKVQEELLEAVHATGTPVVLVLMNGSAVAATWAHDHVAAIIEAWYPGQAGGTALAEALFGDINPGGRLPITIYRTVNDLPPFDDYDMAPKPGSLGRTYRYFTGQPLYAFGYGLSYTRFTYSDLELPAEVTAGEPVTVGVAVRNAGQCSGDEVVQVYLSHRNASVPVPIRQLVGFARLRLHPGGQQHVEFTITPEQMAVFTDDHRFVVEPGTLEIAIGGQQPGAGGGVDAHTTQVLTGTVTVKGQTVAVGG